jgi:outer membrane immunogenic protein
VKKLSVSSIALVALAGSAGAADLGWPRPAYVPAAVAVPVFTWTGCYIGANVGGAWPKFDVTYTQSGAYLTAYDPADVAFADNLGSGSATPRGFIGGGQAGCNYQASALVVGIEGDVDFFHAKADFGASGTLPVALTAVSAATSVSTDSLYTLRGRLGLAVDRGMFFVTGGLAVGNVSFQETFFHAGGPPPPPSYETGTVSQRRTTWTAGFGLEYSLTDSWLAKIEYLYVNLGSVGFISANNMDPTFTAIHSADIKESIIRVGVNYKFF